VTDGERTAAAVVLSLALHWLVLNGWKSVPMTTDGAATDDMVVVDTFGMEVGISLATSITLEQTVVPAAPDEKTSVNAAAAERQREAMTRYLDQLSETVHSRRRIADAGKRLVGNALCRIVIESDGRFSSVTMLRSSGDAQLDADALGAVHSISGAVPRPRILGGKAIAIALTVKYQFGL
jgi:TonB family protein